MGKHWCVSVNDTTIDIAKSYPPGVATALGISAVTLLCLTCISVDISRGIRRRKPWLPCKFFSLNSITLSLLSIATRLPSDRATLMISPVDQLCKLSGTVLICISMGFLMPSLGTEKGPESIKNMASLSILVVAAEFNVIAQIITGAIFSFIVEHVIVLIIMFVLLIMLWSICLEVTQGKEPFDEFKRSHFSEVEINLKNSDGMLSHIEWCYIFGYTSSPQLLLGLVTHSATIGLLCMFSMLILLEASLGFFVLKRLDSCHGIIYDSGWAMKVVLVVQILTIVVGNFGTSFRWFVMVHHIDLKTFKMNLREIQPDWFFESVYEKLYSLPWKYSGTIYYSMFRALEALLTFILIGIGKALEWTSKFVLVSSLRIYQLLAWISLRNTIRSSGNESVEERDFENAVHSHGHNTHANESVEEGDFENAIHSHGHNMMVKWILSYAVKDQKLLIKRFEEKHPESLIELLQKHPPPPDNTFKISENLESLGNIFRDTFENKCWTKYRVSCLSVVVLVRMIDSVIPSSLFFLNQVLNDSFDIIYLIDKNLFAESIQDENRLMLAEDLWMCKNFKCHWFYMKFIEPSLKNIARHSRPKLDQNTLSNAIRMIEELNSISEEDVLKGFELFVITKFILLRKGLYKSLEDLNTDIEQVLAELFYSFLRHLPKLIFNDVVNSTVEKCEERSKVAMKLLCKVKQLEEKVEYLPFDTSGITQLKSPSHISTADDKDADSDTGQV